MAFDIVALVIAVGDFSRRDFARCDPLLRLRPRVVRLGLRARNNKMIDPKSLCCGS